MDRLVQGINPCKVYLLIYINRLNIPEKILVSDPKCLFAHQTSKLVSFCESEKLTIWAITKIAMARSRMAPYYLFQTLISLFESRNSPLITRFCRSDDSVKFPNFNSNVRFILRGEIMHLN
ncbi:unnamed protein product [Moneuplotes crassus]|uniref:Uncharacterized protein n=1 Tax=Euplotes crassus TaxID=5936 RepID=A0AAD1UPV6_EUPCR|nr:unnamed protein product [Moneuplotes crassus]